MNDSATIYYLPRIHTALAEWLFTIMYMLPQRKRFSKGITFGISTGFLAALILVNRVGETQPPLLWMALMGSCLLLMGLQLWSTCQLSLTDTVYVWARAFLAAEFSASLEWQVTYYVLHTVKTESYEEAFLISYGILAGVYLVIFLILSLLEKMHGYVGRTFQVSRQESAGAAVIALVAFGAGNFNFAFQNTIFAESMGAGVLWVRTLVDLSGIIMLFAHSALRQEFLAAKELENMDRLMKRQYEQYRMQRENDETLHRLYHDLKHQIEFIREEQDDEKRSEYLSELREVIRRHEAAAETGNTVLDTILTGKNMICMEKKISMTSFADAKVLDFLNIMDLCAIFGNALDNAIEYEEKIPEEEKRLIKVMVYRQELFSVISVANYCEEKILNETGLLRTTKKDKQMHGYGIKSIRSIAQKYDGHVSFEQEGNWFTLRILFPSKNIE